MIRSISTLTLACAAMLAFAACGDDDKSPGNETSQDTRTQILPEGYRQASAPRFNYAGTQIAMVGQTEAGEEHIVITDRAGKLERVVRTTGASYLTTFAWSSDDDTLYYSGDGGILSVDPTLEDAEPTVVVDSFAVLGFDISRDGSKVAWSVNGQRDLSLGSLTGEGVLDDTVDLQAVQGSQPRFSPSGEQVLHLTGEETMAIAPVSDFQPGAVTTFEGEASYLSHGAWLDEDTVLLLLDDAIIRQSISTMERVVLEEQFAATGLDVDQSGAYIFHVNGSTQLTLVESP